jgi:hypothetical protein
MDIHLAKPGGRREGPYTLEQINASLAEHKYRETDYWAWYEGLESWVPLHQIPGVIDAPKSLPETNVAEPLAAAQVDTQIIESQPSTAAVPQPSVPSGLFSGMPAQALEQIFVFTNGEGPAAMRSAVSAQMLREILGAPLETIRDQAPRDVFGRCSIPTQLAEEGAVPASAWRAMSAIRPELTQQARDGAYRICVRTFDTETGQKVAAFLFYNKEKI